VIDLRLFDHYGIDTNKDLGINAVCARPFDTVLIDKNGSCYACECTSWLPQSIGNLQIRTLKEIIESPMRKTLQQSVSNGRYNFCNEKQCGYLKDLDFINEFERDRVTNIRLAIDDSCNLQCPSCRLDKVFHSKGSTYNRRIKLADKVLDYVKDIDHPLTVNIGSDGDPFASLVYRYVLKNFPWKDNLKFNLQTNGLLLKKFHMRNSVLFDHLTQLNISIDGASKETYEKLRLGGRWEDIQENLSYVSQINRSFPVHIHMVVQKSNWHEMEMLLQQTKKFGFDKIYFNLVQDWNTGIDVENNFKHTKQFRELAHSVDQDPLSEQAQLL